MFGTDVLKSFDGTVVPLELGFIDAFELAESPARPISVLKNGAAAVLSGWLQRTGDMSDDVEPVAVIRELESGRILTYPLDLVLRPDLVAAYGDETSEHWGMYGSIVPMTMYEVVIGAVEVTLGWQHGEDTLWSLTEIRTAEVTYGG